MRQKSKVLSNKEFAWATEFSSSKMDCDNLPRYCLVSGYDRISWLMNLGNKALVMVKF